MTNMSFEVYTVEQDSETKYGPKKGDRRVKIYGKGLEFDHCIENDKDGNEYFCVPNLLIPDLSYSNCLFIDRVKDMFDTVVNGDGDCILTTNLLFRSNHVIYFVNREIGDSYRKKFLTGWEDTKFAYAICCNHIPFTKDGKYSYDQKDIQYYDTEEEAIEAKKSIEREAIVIKEEYRKIEDESNRHQFLKNFFDSKDQRKIDVFLDRKLEVMQVIRL